MASRHLGVIVEHLCRLSAQTENKQLSDQQLLDRYVCDRSEAAFQALVGRCGQTVLRVCRRVLSQPEDVEDAFQATFLVLVRKAASLRRSGSLRSWLYGVAYRTAAHAKVDAAKRHAREAQVPARAEADALAEITLRELLIALDEELFHLPKQYQGPLLLCYLEGKTRDEAAAELGWSLATLGRRLERGRELLRTRLARRGIAFPVALGPLLLLQSGARAEIPMALIASTVKAATRVGVGSSAATVASARVVALSEGVIKTMWATKVTQAIVLFLALGLVSAGAGLVAQTRNAHPGNEPKKDDAAKPAATDQCAADRARLLGEWVFYSVASRGQDLMITYRDSRMTFAGDELRISNIRVPTAQGLLPLFNISARFLLDPAQTPHHIDLEFKGGSRGSDRPMRLRGIYAFEGDTLKLCLSDEGDRNRPAEFKATPESDRTLLVLKRPPKQPAGRNQKGREGSESDAHPGNERK